MNRGISEQDEFLLSRLLDGDLSAAESEALRDRMQREPALQEAFASLTRIDALLSGQAGDQPGVDWPVYHGRVMEAVRAQRRPVSKIIRFPLWLGATGAVAAAAAVVLMVTTHRPLTDVPEPGKQGSAIRVAFNQQQPAVGDGELIVNVHRAGAARREPLAPIQVTFAPSEKRAKWIAQVDRAAEESAGSVTALTQQQIPEPQTVDVDLL